MSSMVFRKDKSCSNQSFAVKRLREKMNEKKKEAFLAIVDLQKTYDRKLMYVASTGGLWSRRNNFGWEKEFLGT